MWRCPKCGREFKKINQGHYCGSAPLTVDDYIDLQDDKTHAHLITIKNAIHKSVPDCKESIAWSMPTYKNGDNAVSFAACKNHVSLYVGAEAIDFFKKDLQEYTTKKSAVYFPYDKELSSELLENMVKWCLS